MGEVLAAATAGFNIGGTILRAKGAEQTADAISDAARLNAELARREGFIEEARRRRIGRRALSSQRVAFAKAGVQLEGSPIEFLANAASEFERDAVNARVSGLNTAALDEARADNAQIIGRQRARAEFLAGAADVGTFGLSLIRGADVGEGRLVSSTRRRGVAP